MRKESLEQFINQVAESEELQARIGDEIDGDGLIALGTENGFEFTTEDLQETAKISDEELDEVAAGTGWSYLVRHEESDLDFVDRSAARDGVSYYFRNSDSEKGTTAKARKTRVKKFTN